MIQSNQPNEAFDRVLDKIDEVKAQNQDLKREIDERFNELNGKIDIIMRGITGLGNS
jgi:hypothetical protein